MRSDDDPPDAPGLKRRRNRDGSVRLYWVASLKGFKPSVVRLQVEGRDLDEADPDDRLLIEEECQRLQAEMLGASSQVVQPPPFDGTIAALVRLYQTDEASPYQTLKWNTRRNHDQELRLIVKAFGKRTLATLRHADFHRWYTRARASKSPGGRERIRKAHGLITRLRGLFAYGALAEHAGCRRLDDLLARMRFEQPGPRRQKLTLENVRAFIRAALAHERHSLALGMALQFETTLRQRDVIGEWEPIPPGEEPSGIVLNGRRWVNGLTWEGLGPFLQFEKGTTKTGAVVLHDLALCPIVLPLLLQVPEVKRSGPLIIDEKAGRPYAEHAYQREWRVIANRAGLPHEVWNMDARAGGLSEGNEAGAPLEDLATTAGHTQLSTTKLYLRATIGPSRRVMQRRAAHRTMEESD